MDSDLKEKLFLAGFVIVLAIILSYVFCQYLSLNTTHTIVKDQLSKCEDKAKVSITYEEIDTKKKEKITSYIKTYYKRVSLPVAELIAKHAVVISEEFLIPTGLVMGIMEVESGFDPSQVSNAKARGLMQVRWSVWKKYLTEKTTLKNEFDLHEIDDGIHAGVLVLRYYIDKNNGNLSDALYDYVGKSKGYAEKVYKSMGRFMLYD
jgi:hypothetical protein